MLSLLRPPFLGAGVPKIDLGGCVLYLPLWRPSWDMTGATIYSYDRNRWSCTVTGAVWGSQGRVLDGTDDYLTRADVAALSALTPLTVEAWFKQTSAKTAGLVSKHDGSAGNREWMLRTDSSGQIWFVYLSSVSSNSLTAASTRTISDNIWHHVVATWDGVNATGHIKQYIDGTSETLSADTQEGTGAVAYDGVAPVEIGRYNGSNTQCFNGSIGEVRLYKRVLSAAEAVRNYQMTKWRY